MISTKKNERRDWTLLIFIIPVGIILIILVGQFAVRLVPFWSVNADMNSNLEPDPASARPFALLEPILPQILTPMAWAQTYLTPGAEISFPPFLTFEPTTTPSPTPVTPTSTSETPTPTATTPSPSPTVVVATTPPASGGGGGGSPTTCQDPTADNFGGTLPCDFTSTTTCTDPTADNFGGALPCDFTSTTICIDTAANNYGGALPCVFPITSTIDVSVYGTPVTPIPSELGVGTAPDNTNPNDDSNIGTIADGTYIVISLSVKVEATPDDNYDLVFYEFNNDGAVYMDRIIIGISDSPTGDIYYEVFNWGNGTADTNSNIGDVAGSETDDQQTALTELYDPDKIATPPSDGPAPQTGILIDVDKAPSNPPVDHTYNYVVIISPFGGLLSNPAQVDAVQTVEVPTP